MQSSGTIESQGNIDNLSGFLRAEPDVEFAVLVGSRADGTATPDSDWDIAIRLRRAETSYMEELARTEALRREIATILRTAPEQVDLISATSAKLAMRDLIANHGLVLTDPTNLAWIHFLQRTWRDLEDYYWDELYAG